jgi:hypothetical protein
VIGPAAACPLREGLALIFRQNTLEFEEKADNDVGPRAIRIAITVKLFFLRG